ncbi:MAG: DUF839 domain-containing protein [Flaviramulus sp.]|nr:alkaline phosphatase PhoX [Flaviramulus sp.]NNC50633.1 DUF839 domain-containing protein [Flaviramulus sp.]
MKTLLLSLALFTSLFLESQNIGDFTSITPATQTEAFVISSSHTFQKIIEVGDALDIGGSLPINPDFTGYVPITGSSTNGYLSINSEAGPGGNTILDINFDSSSNLWEITASEAVDFTDPNIVGTFANCSGTVTSWGTVITSEEFSIPNDTNSDGYYDVGWNIEIDPVTKTVVNNQKLWALGNFKHENVVVHSNDRTVYQGADDTSGFGFLYKFVATTAQDLSKGDLYVYTGPKSGSGSWVMINDSSIPAHETPSHRNNTMALANGVGATNFVGIEDVEIGPDGWIYFAVKSAPDKRVYRFQDSDPITGTTVTNMETFVGNTDTNPNIEYNIFDGNNTTAVAWGSGNDNLAFDNDGNLWVLQDGSTDYIWVVKSGHTQAIPDVEIFGVVPLGAEPTGITFSPDNKFLFMSVQHPDSGNVANQIDAAGNTVNFDKGTVLVIARNENLGTSLFVKEPFTTNYKLFPNPLESNKILNIKGIQIDNVQLFSILGEKLLDVDYNNANEVNLKLKNRIPGLYLIKINNKQSIKLIIN